MKKILFGISMFMLLFCVSSLGACGKTCKHQEEIIPGKAATCTETGLTEGKKCSVCSEILVEQEIIEKKDHTLSDVAANEKTCTEAGNIAHKHCSVCEKNFDAEGKELSTVVIPASHTLTDVAEVPATCKNEGTIAHKHCSVCEKNFDVEGNDLNDLVIAKLTHIDENLDIDCDREGCTGKVAPKADSTLSLATANHLGSKLSTSSSYYVEGTIVEVLDAKNGIFYIGDGTGEKFYFRLPVDESGVSHANWTVKLVLGDKVRVYGKVGKFSTSTAPNGSYYPAIAGGLVTYIEQHPHVFGEPTCVDPGYCACGQDGPVALDHHDGDGDDLCDRCKFDVTLTIEGVEVRTDNNSGVTDADNLSTTWSGTNFDVIVAKGTSSQLYSSSKDHMRIYKGNKLTISNKTGITVKSIILHATNGTQLTNIENMLTNLTYTKNEDDFTITIEWNSAENLVLINNGSTTQLKFVEITYKNN